MELEFLPFYFVICAIVGISVTVLVLIQLSNMSAADAPVHSTKVKETVTAGRYTECVVELNGTKYHTNIGYLTGQPCMYSIGETINGTLSFGILSKPVFIVSK